MFPDWFVGFSFAAIAIGALVPAAIMSIGAANTFTRNIWKPFVNSHMSDGEEGTVAKLVSLLVKLGALIVILAMPTQYAIDFQLLGGVWMIQCFPAILIGLFTGRLNSWALLAGWAIGMLVGTALAWGPTTWTPTHAVFGWFSAYNGLLALALNVATTFHLSAILASDAAEELSLVQAP